MVGYASSRGGAVAARRAHNPEVAGSNPAPATKSKLDSRIHPAIFILGCYWINSVAGDDIE